MAEKTFNIGGLSSSSFLYFISKHFKEGLVVVSDSLDLIEAAETLQFFSPEARVLKYPAYENFYSLVKQDPQIQSERLATQSILLKGTRGIFVVTTLRALRHLTLVPDKLKSHILKIQVGDWLERDALAKSLDVLGYKKDSISEDRGFYCVRGHLIDIFPFTSNNPIRIEFFGDEVVSMREFDSESQRSLNDLKALDVFPQWELLFKDSDWPSVKEQIKNFSDENAYDRFERDKVLLDLQNRFEPLESRWFLPAVTTPTPLFDYFSPSFPLITHNLDEEIKLCKQEAKEELARYETLERLAYPPNTITDDQIETRLKNAHHLSSGVSDVSDKYNVKSLEGLRNKILIQKNFSPLSQFVRELLEKDIKTTLVIRNPKRMKAIEESCELPVGVELLQGPLFSGFSSPTMCRAYINEKDIFGTRRRRSLGASLKSSTEDFLRQFSDMKIGDYVIHEDHGIAKFLGLQVISIQNQENEFLVLEYQNADKLYLPVYRFDKISRYVSEGYAQPRLDRLGTQDFVKRKSKIKNDILKIAHELLQIAAQRKLRVKNRDAEWDSQLYQKFCESFAYDLTHDQETAIDAIERDLQNPWPMDRLVCGDVGFGKTEVAMRAAMLTVLRGGQVAVLAPTTLLAEQHFRGFKERFSPLGIRVSRLSRFVSTKDQKEIVNEINKGDPCIIIGTHRLLQNDIDLNRAALLVIDEEQRFGVKHKEKIKKARELIDVLTLSATPIPRTLQMSIVGIRDLSLIVTPPENREAVKTMVGLFDDKIVRGAIEKEVQRGGQVLVVHNRVKTIDAFAAKIQKLVPEYEIRIVHGQLSEEGLEKRMMDFIQQKAKILVATSIIENGLDIPSANTLIVDHAEMFGLSELYQLRGRVGRSHLTASAYFLLHETTELTPEASKRLQVIASCTELGSGFKVSTHDMEIRGAGNLLGEEQSGIIAEVGLELYNQMLEQTLAELSKGVAPDPLPEINSGFSAFIPENYIPDAIIRIATYKQLNRCQTPAQVLQFESELLDRFGLYPKELDNLCQTMRIRSIAYALKATSVDIYPGRFSMTLSNNTALNPTLLIPLIGKKISLDQKGKLTMHFQSSFKDPQLALGTKHADHPEMLDFLKIIEFLKGLCEKASLSLDSI